MQQCIISVDLTKIMYDLALQDLTMYAPRRVREQWDINSILVKSWFLFDWHFYSALQSKI